MAQNTPRKQTSATISNTGANLTGGDPEGQGYVAGSFPHFLFFWNDLSGRANLRNCRPLIALRDDKRLLPSVNLEAFTASTPSSTQKSNGRKL
jgi:hypothetical protein